MQSRGLIFLRTGVSDSRHRIACIEQFVLPAVSEKLVAKVSSELEPFGPG